jgi:uncharacterized phage-associated protein
MLGAFTAEKVIQAAGILLKATEPHRMSRLRLLKLLYIADRESIQRSGRPITGDDAVAMDHGPVLSRTYDCIKGGDAATGEWEKFIRRSGSQDVELVVDPGIGTLSRWEIAKLQEVAQRHEHLDDYSIAVLTHGYGEWQKNQPPVGSSRRIPARDILEAVGLGEAADEILAEARTYAEARRLLAGALR